MATDKSEPRVGRILLVGALATITLVAVRSALVSYFDHITAGEQHRKFADIKPEALMNVRADERLRLTSGMMPVQTAIEQMVARGRSGASPDVMPTASKDIAPLQGWSKMPAVVPVGMTAPASADATPTAGAVVDAGVGASAGDGGATTPHSPRTDGGPGPKSRPRPGDEAPRRP